MSQQRVAVSLDFLQPIDALFPYLAEHENQRAVFSVPVERLRDGDAQRNGVGSVRRLSSAPLPPWEETITVFEENRRIEYRITKGSPLRDHHGVMLFSPSSSGAGTHLDYTITFYPRYPLTGWFLRTMTERNLRKGLEGLARRGTL